MIIMFAGDYFQSTLKWADEMRQKLGKCVYSLTTRCHCVGLTFRLY